MTDLREISLGGEIGQNVMLNNFCNSKFLPIIHCFQENRQFPYKSSWRKFLNLTAILRKNWQHSEQMTKLTSYSTHQLIPVINCCICASANGVLCVVPGLGELPMWNQHTAIKRFILLNMYHGEHQEQELESLFPVYQHYLNIKCKNGVKIKIYIWCQNTCTSSIFEIHCTLNCPYG
jgi:hypothetical protein